MTSTGNKIATRKASLLITLLRNFLLGREHNTALRFAHEMSSRSPPMPEIPRTCDVKLSGFYYNARAPMLRVKPPLDVSPPVKDKLCPTGKPSSDVVPTPPPPYPGPLFNWDSHKY